MCNLWKEKITRVNDDKVVMFLQKGKTIEDQKINAAKILNESSIPPCFQVRQIIKHSAYI